MHNILTNPITVFSQTYYQSQLACSSSLRIEINASLSAGNDEVISLVPLSVSKIILSKLKLTGNISWAVTKVCVPPGICSGKGVDLIIVRSVSLPDSDQ